MYQVCLIFAQPGWVRFYSCRAKAKANNFSKECIHCTIAKAKNFFEERSHDVIAKAKNFSKECLHGAIVKAKNLLKECLHDAIAKENFFTKCSRGLQKAKNFFNWCFQPI